MSHCASTGGRAWWIYTWKRDTPGKKTRRPYHCCSWRCRTVDPTTGRSCARFDASVAFARIKEAFTPLPHTGVVFMVLTLDREGFYSGRRRWSSPQAAYRELSTMTRKFLKRVNRMCESRGWERVGSRWVGVVEAHRTGWPHMNLMFYCPQLAAELQQDFDARHAGLVAGGMNEKQATRHARLLSGELLHHATATNWGVESTAERARSNDALAGYFTKLAGEGGRVTGELAKLTQAPLNAPVRFRRLRAGKGFLPPRRRNPEVTGTLVRRQREHDGTYTVMPLHKVKAEALPQVLQCCYHEEEIAHEELRVESLRRRFKGLPLYATDMVSTWFVAANGRTGPPSQAGLSMVPRGPVQLALA